MEYPNPRDVMIGQMFEKIQEHLSVLANLVHVPLAASAESTCESTGREPPEGYVWASPESSECRRSITGRHKWGFCSFCFSEKPTESTPRKVWGVQEKSEMRVVRMFASSDAAHHYVHVMPTWEYYVAEYEVADD